MKDAQNELPKGWAPTNIGEICTALQYGYTASASDEACGPRFLRITDIQNGHVKWSTVPYCEIDTDQTAKYELRAGDIVFARTGGTVGKSFIITSVPEQSVFASYLIRLSAHPKIEPKFLYYFFQSGSYWEQIGLKKGGLQGNVNATTLSSLELFVCPLNEQRRIVQKIEELFSELDEGVESLKIAQEQLKVYRQAVLKYAFEGKLTAKWRNKSKDKRESTDQLLARIKKERENHYEQQLAGWKAAVRKWEAEGQKGNKPSKPIRPSEIRVLDFEGTLADLPDGWLWVTLDSIGKIETGNTPPTKDASFFGGSIPFLKPTDLDTGYYVKQARDHLTEAGAEVSRPFPANSVLVTCIGATIGKTGLSRLAGACNQQINFIIPDGLATAEFAYFQIISPAFQDQIKSNASSTTLPIINKRKFSELAFGLCDPKEQTELVRVVEEKLSIIESTEVELTMQLTLCTSLRQSILKKAFSGQLVEQDPGDEPASVLLERIKAEKSGQNKANKNNKRKDAA